jgi:hypothetical protein
VFGVYGNFNVRKLSTNGSGIFLLSQPQNVQTSVSDRTGSLYKSRSSGVRKTRKVYSTKPRKCGMHHIICLHPSLSMSFLNFEEKTTKMFLNFYSFSFSFFFTFRLTFSRMQTATYCCRGTLRAMLSEECIFLMEHKELRMGDCKSIRPT